MNDIRSIKIGNIVCENNIFLAPMAGITDMPFRLLCKEYGAGLVTTEMVSAKGLYYNDSNSKKIIEIGLEEGPISIQIFGSDPYIMAKAAYDLNDSKASIIDINMGCPVPKIVKNREGCALMLNPELASEIIKEVCSASEKPVTVKLRKGWNDLNINVVEMAKIAEQNHASAVAVHGRTREQFYSGKADYDSIKMVKQAVSIPVIGNGDIFNAEDAQEMLSYTGCDAVMVARGALGNPWIFREILEYAKTGDVAQKPTVIEKIEMIRRHTDMFLAYKGERLGVIEMRKHIAWYVKGIKNSASVKSEIFKITSKELMFELLNKLI